MVRKMDFHTVYRYIGQFCLIIQIVWGLDEVTFVNPPVEALPDYKLEILYSCDQPATIQLDCVVYFEMGTISTLLLTQWTCVPGDPDIRTMKLNLPDWLVYQADGIVPEPAGVLSCILQASVRYEGFDDNKRPITAKDVAALQLKPFFSRPVKQHQLCIAWSKQMLQLSEEFLQKQCPCEQETVHLLSTIYASTGETFGVTKTLDPFRNELLEYQRLKAISFPWCTFSIWIFVTSYCQESVCGVFHHIDSLDNYATPTLLLTNSGQLHIQISGEAEESSAFLSSFKVPLHEWCQLGVMLQGRAVTISMTCIDKEQRTIKFTEYMLRHAAVFDDTEGYFVIGGGKYIKSAEGYFGPVVYYRNRASSHVKSDVIPDVIKKVNLTGWLQTCEEFRFDMTLKIGGFSLKAKQETESETCFDALHKWMLKRKIPTNHLCELWEEAAPHRRQAAELAKLLVFKNGKAVSLPALGRALYSLSLHKLSRASSTAVVSRILPLLLQAGCLADNQALHMSSVLLSTGLGVQKQHNKAWLLALLAAQKDDRLSLLHLGYLHHQGLHGLPRDPDLACAYYANIAKQTIIDRHNPTPNQTFVEAIYLNDDEKLNLQTNKDHHIFQWLKLQASRGAVEAEQSLARMLFWGQQGLSPNIEEAVKHYRRGAVQLEDPVSMYDYGIVLLQGHGVEKDIPKAVTFLKKAMEQDFVPAINALAWYYEQFEHDYNQAVQLWEKADLLESPDAAFNLGVMYSGGLYPGEPANQYMAYKYYLKSAERAHVKGAVQLAEIWTTGIPGYVKRYPSDAALWVKWAAEHNGYLGSILQKALDSYLKSDMLISLLYYMMVAESGYAPAQFNVAYICEQNVGGFLDPADAARCMWRYYNLTIQSQNPDTYAFIKMGDLLYEGCDSRQKDLISAAQMYTMAALRNNPQGWYNLALLSEDGFRLPLSILIELGLSELYLADNNLLLNAFYKRCRDSGDTDSYLPCSLALYNVFLQSFHKDYSAAIKFSTTAAVVAAPTMFILGVLRRRALSVN
ncbi:protein sel-1 homolog 3 [Melanotaenia boesemani]|uniref:protein sel-1 homolog 3 n=1 Tax=Melanotaenia boesemani TaxID=1250792 RepID=UPI001C0448C4|nr:protein sel-1 homolog 3 [Melanotaenia boesemani]